MGHDLTNKKRAGVRDSTKMLLQISPLFLDAVQHSCSFFKKTSLSLFPHTRTLTVIKHYSPHLIFPSQLFLLCISREENSLLPVLTYIGGFGASAWISGLCGEREDMGKQILSHLRRTAQTFSSSCVKVENWSRSLDPRFNPPRQSGVSLWSTPPTCDGGGF